MSFVRHGTHGGTLSSDNGANFIFNVRATYSLYLDPVDHCESMTADVCVDEKLHTVIMVFYFF